MSIQVIDCDFSNIQHMNAVTDLLNAYILDEMGGGTPLDKEQQSRLIEELRKNPKNIVLLAVDEEKFIGLLNAFEVFSTFAVKPVINVHDVFVDNAYRGKKVGRKLFDKLIEKAKERDCAKITLEVRHDNISAQKLYKSFGFEDTNPPMYFWVKTIN